jgi:two-component system cell cycle sensor histidine kinase/response regulator CckA
MLYFIDATEQKHLQIQFAQSQKMQAIGQLAGGVAHDFNNLLTAMIGFCDLLLQRHKPGDQSFNDIIQIKQNGNRAAGLVRQLLAFSRQQTLQPKVLSLADVLSELANLLRRLIGAEIKLEMVHGRDVGLVKVDQGQLEQVIINLVVNARDAMPHGGTVMIRTRNYKQETRVMRGQDDMPPGDYVMIEVADSGTGIPPDILQRIFEPFFSTKEIGSGTGLGLSTVYGIVRQTGGFIGVDSTVGKGSTFMIYLPVFDNADGTVIESKPEDIREEKPGPDLTGAGTLLLVEDEDAVRLFSCRALRNKGYNVLEARSGEEALEVLNKEGDKVDLIVSDVVMPQMDGPTLYKHVREKWPNIKVIFVSGYTEDRLREQFTSGEVIYFLPKPFTLKQLAGKVKDVMEET